MPLRDIIHHTGIKRKALAVVQTRCRLCLKDFPDKYYYETVHRVICPFCSKLNAIVDFDNILQVLIMGLRYDMGTMGRYGFYLDSRKKIMNILRKFYGEDADAKMLELLTNLKMTQEEFERWFKTRKAMRRTQQIS